MFKRLLVPLDGSRFGTRALKYVDEIARRFDAEVVLIQVIKPPAPVSAMTGVMPGTGPTAVEVSMEVALEEDKRRRAHAVRYLGRKVRENRAKGIRTSYKLMFGNPAKSIMKLSRRENIDLVVMSTHGKGGLKRALLGSVADEVIRESKKPVLVVRPKTGR